MKLQTIFSQLAYGELSQHVLGTHTDGQVDEAQYPALINHINLGLTALFKRFNLKEGRTTVPLVDGTYTYTVAVPDLLKIERVYTDGAMELALNDLGDKYALATPSHNSLRVPKDIVDQVLSLPEQYSTAALEVVYRANHAPLVLTLGTIDPDATEVALPESHLEALLYFIASRVNNPIGMGQEFNAGNNWFNRYEMECQRLEQQNLQIDRVNEADRFAVGGWV